MTCISSEMGGTIDQVLIVLIMIAREIVVMPAGLALCPYLFYDHLGCLAYGLHDLPSRPAHPHLPWGQPPQPRTWGSTGHGPGARQPRQGAGTQKWGVVQ